MLLLACPAPLAGAEAPPYCEAVWAAETDRRTRTVGDLDHIEPVGTGDRWWPAQNCRRTYQFGLSVYRCVAAGVKPKITVRERCDGARARRSPSYPLPLGHCWDGQTNTSPPDLHDRHHQASVVDHAVALVRTRISSHTSSPFYLHPQGCAVDLDSARGTEGGQRWSYRRRRLHMAELHLQRVAYYGWSPFRRQLRVRPDRCRGQRREGRSRHPG